MWKEIYEPHIEHHLGATGGVDERGHLQGPLSKLPGQLCKLDRHVACSHEQPSFSIGPRLAKQGAVTGLSAQQVGLHLCVSKGALGKAILIKLSVHAEEFLHKVMNI